MFTFYCVLVIIIWLALMGILLYRSLNHPQADSLWVLESMEEWLYGSGCAFGIAVFGPIILVVMGVGCVFYGAMELIKDIRST